VTARRQGSSVRMPWRVAPRRCCLVCGAAPALCGQ
jgi:hypothetical protein